MVRWMLACRSVNELFFLSHSCGILTSYDRSLLFAFPPLRHRAIFQTKTTKSVDLPWGVFWRNSLVAWRQKLRKATVILSR
jgi:hypothetical protein